jgi:hypothetical protein
LQQLLQHTLVDAITINDSGMTGITSVMALFNMVEDAMNLRMMPRRSMTTFRGRERRYLGPRTSMRRPMRQTLEIIRGSFWTTPAVLHPMA